MDHVLRLRCSDHCLHFSSNNIHQPLITGKEIEDRTIPSSVVVHLEFTRLFHHEATIGDKDIVVSAIASCGIDGRPYFRWYLRNRNKRMEGRMDRRTCMPHSVFIILPVGGLEKSRAVLVADSISRVSHVHAPLNAANAVNERGASSRLA